MSRTQGLYITFPQSFQISRKKSALKPLNPSACLSILRTNERSTVHISHRFYTSLKRLWAVYQSVFVYLRVYDMCVDANVLSMYSGVQLTITVLHQAYRTVSFTLKWPHVVTAVAPHTAFCLDNMGDLMPRVKPYLLVRVRARLHVCVRAFVRGYVLLTSCGDKMCAICAHRRLHTRVHVWVVPVFSSGTLANHHREAKSNKLQPVSQLHTDF